jgi:putative transcriptional regulator
VSRQTIISIEKDYYLPTTQLALKLAKKLGTTVENLFVLTKNDWK